MKLHWRYFFVSLVMIVACIWIPAELYPICEGCCVCSVSAHLNERVMLQTFFMGLAWFFFAMSKIEEWANGS
jgi:hypothetical protein